MTSIRLRSRRSKKEKKSLAKKYSEKDYQRDMTVCYTQTAVGFIKLYGPAVTLGVASLFCFVAGHGIMRKRNVALVAAYKAIEEGFAAYRKRVVEEHGEETDYMYKNGIHKETYEEVEVDEKGKSKTVQKTRVTQDPNGPSIYAKFFDESNPNWDKDAQYNFMFLLSQQRYFNNILQAKGHVFLNEVYDALGFEHTRAGAVVGWYLGNGDSVVDFGIFDGENPKKRDFVNGYERSIIPRFQRGWRNSFLSVMSIVGCSLWVVAISIEIFTTTHICT